MDYKKFQTASRRTMPFEGYCTNNQELWNALSNYALGVLGEWHELQKELNKVSLLEVPGMDLVNKIEGEIGDVMHYLIGLLSIQQLEFDESKLEKIESLDEVEEDLSNIAECIKKYIYHGHKLDQEKFVNSIYRVISHLNTNFKNVMGIILEKNIQKLKIRYPEKFTTEASVARVDVK